jgi:hypothetical protein
MHFENTRLESCRAAFSLSLDFMLQKRNTLIYSLFSFYCIFPNQDTSVKRGYFASHNFLCALIPNALKSYMFSEDTL